MSLAAGIWWVLWYYGMSLLRPKNGSHILSEGELERGFSRIERIAGWFSGRVIILNFNEGYYRDVALTRLVVVLCCIIRDLALTALGLMLVVVLSRCRTWALGLWWVCVVLWRCRFSLRPRMGRYNLSEWCGRTRIFADWADGSRLVFGRVIISNFNWRGYYRDVALTAVMGLCCTIEMSRTYGAWIVFGFGWFYRDVALRRLELWWVCVVLWRCRFVLRPRMGPHIIYQNGAVERGFSRIERIAGWFSVG